MRFHLLPSLLASASLVIAFKDTAPFVLLSSDVPLPPLEDVLTDPQPIQHLSSVLSTAHDFLRNSDSDITILLSSSSFPGRLEIKHAAKSADVKTRFAIPEVVGVKDQDVRNLAAFLKRYAGTETIEYEGARIFVRGAEGKEGERLRDLGLGRWVGDGTTAQTVDLTELAQSRAKYTIIYLGLPGTERSLAGKEDMPDPWREEFAATSHIDLRRDMGVRKDTEDREKPGNSTDDRGLFEKYQYFTPGIFMGLLTALLMLAIGSVGLNAVSSLQVSYGAFDKENGPAAAAGGGRK